MQKAGGAKGCPFLSLIRRRANSGRGTIHRALRNRYWGLAVGGWEHTETGGRGEATPLPEAALRRPYVVTRSRPYPRQKPSTQRETGDRIVSWGLKHFSGLRSRPSGIWYGFSGSGAGSGGRSSVIDSVLHSVLNAVLYSVLNSSKPASPTLSHNRRRLCRGGCDRRRRRSI